MTDHPRRRLQRATAILPLALLSVAWTASLASPQDELATVDQQQALPEPGSLPDGSTLPSEAIEAPASLSSPSRAGGLGIGGRDAAVARNASTNDIPAAALAAYQRAETVVNAADKSCQVPWQLIAAIGRVESDHGRYDANVLDDDGVAQPGIYGVPLNGGDGTARISDTDAGQLDNDRDFDRAVGPMQFIPSTWAVVGVDADGDGERNPQDVDDAALATGVYLCSGPDDLSERPGQRAAVFRYNNSSSYVDLVISVMESYLGGDFTSVPTGTTAAAPIAPVPAPPVAPTQPQFQPTPAPSTVSSSPTGGSTGTTGTTSGPVSSGTSGDGDTGGTTPAAPQTQSPEPEPPAPQPPKAPNPPSTPNVPNTGAPPVDDTVTRAEATATCTAQSPLASASELEKCIANLVG